MLDLKIPEEFVYDGLQGFSIEVIKKHKPPTFFNASQISGVTLSALDILHLNIDMKGNIILL